MKSERIRLIVMTKFDIFEIKFRKTTEDAESTEVAKERNNNSL